MGHIWYLGHSGFEIEIGGSVIYIDPVLEWKEMECRVKPPLKVDEIDKADLVMITHEHKDHFEKSTVERIVAKTNATVIAPKQVLKELEIPSSNRMAVSVGEEFVVKGVEVKVVKAVHPQSEYPVGYIIKKGGKSIYHAGDTYEFGGMFDIEADYALIPIGGTYTMDIYSAHKAVKELKCRYVIPMHYNTFERIKQSVSDFVRGVDTDKVKPIVMKAGDMIEI
ncbi:MAG: metal-dependent hydrolase [Candidatus Micrarchaeia archaeon]